MRCGNCGEEVIDGSLTCPTCGAMYRPAPLSRFLRLVFGGAGVVALLIAAVIFFRRHVLGDVALSAESGVISIGCFVACYFVGKKVTRGWYR